jgi:hypothetical protein
MKMHSKLALAAMLLGGVLLAIGSGVQAGSGVQPVSRAVAKAAGATTMSSSRCISFCESTSTNKAQCSGNCTAGLCYKNANSGNHYCVE